MSLLRALSLFMVIASSLTATLRAAETKDGAMIYKNLCASCHGTNGEGNPKEYELPLIGDKSVGELAELIDRTMPVGEPEKCVGDDARRVAQYIYDTFYSPTAQARHKPARVELSRLTARQYAETVADLVGTFTAPAQAETSKKKVNAEAKMAAPSVEPGLWGQYFTSKRFSDKSLMFTRLDGRVKFDFGDQNPYHEADAAEFAVRWQGSVVPVETGDYEFVVRTENGLQLWVNNPTLPLVDAQVRSGADSVYRETLHLLAGRAYPVRLELHKSKAARDKSASVELRWKPPHHVEETIPTFRLSTAVPAETFVVTTPFPPDDRSTGYERGTDVSKAWEQATTDGAIETAAYLSARLRQLTGLNEGEPKRAEKLKTLAEQFVERAFRRPLTKDGRELYVERQFRDAKSPEQALQRVVLLTLKSPRFLYRELGPGKDNAAARDPYTVASRLSFTLWDSLPDAMLLGAAAAGKLQTAAEVREQAERMAADPRVQAKLRQFFLQWLNIEHFGEFAKDRKLYPQFDAELVSDLRTSLDLFLDDVLKSPEADFRRLLTDDRTYMNWRIAKFYNEKLPADSPFTLTKWQPERRAGVLTHPLVMAGLAYTDVSSPIHRGVFVSRSVLGRALRPPPEAVTPLPVSLHPNLSTRERVTLQTKSETCAACHTMINNLGFAFEALDAVGQFRSREKDKPIDAQGSYRTTDDKVVKFNGTHELAKFLAESPETHAAIVEQLFQHATKQPILAYGLDVPDRLRQSFTAQSFNLRKLMVEIAVTAASGGASPSLTSAPKTP
jgi:hypothetical protein